MFDQTSSGRRGPISGRCRPRAVALAGRVDRVVGLACLATLWAAPPAVQQLQARCLPNGDSIGVPPLVPKWSQHIEDCDVNFNAASDLWWPDPDSDPHLPISKWEQLPNPDLPGLNAHDWMGPFGDYHWLTLADQWQCEGGQVLDLHWWGNYELDADGREIRGAGVAHFRLSIHANAPGDPWCLPGDELWSVVVPFSEIVERPTGMVNNEGSPIYVYEYVLATPFDQIEGEIYWFDLEARAVDPGDPPRWRWQEAGRETWPILCPAAYRQDGGPWISFEWPLDPPLYSDMAFRVTSGSIEEVNQTVADDFFSDGRPIEALTWWGSYFDPRYEPDSGDQLHQVDGWLITFHWADANRFPERPPDLLFDPPPTALGVYFAPAGAVDIAGLDCTDCLGHGLYEYAVNLNACCLLCSERDPRNGRYPAREGRFNEESGLRYWLSIQAVTGVEWVPPQCEMRFTGHLPSDRPGNDGHFWGWLSNQAESVPVETDEAAMGRIMDFASFPPHCWEYGEWAEQPYECPYEDLPVHMSFELLAQPCEGDVDGDGDVDQADLGILLAAWDSRPGDPNWDPRADLDGDNHVGQRDLGILLANWGCGRFVG